MLHIKYAHDISLPLISGDKLISYGILLVLVSILNFIFYYVYSRNKFKNLRFRFFWDKKLFSSILSYTGWTLLEMFAWMTQNQGINIVMNIFFGPVVNAARAISLQIQNAIQAFCVNLVTAFRPQLIESYVQTNYHRTKTMMYSMSKIMFVFFFMISTPIIIEVNYILNLWLGDSVPEFTSSFIILMLVSMFPRNFVMAFSQIIEASGIVKQYRIWSSILILLVLPSSYLILRCGGTPPSVYYLNLAVCTVLFVTCAFLLKKVFVFSMLDYGKKIIIPCIIVALITIIILKFECSLIQEGLLRFIMVCVSSLICTCFLSYFIIFKSQEKAMMTSMIYKIFLKLGFRNNSK